MEHAWTLVAWLFEFGLLFHHSAAVHMCHYHVMPDAFCEKSMHNTLMSPFYNFQAPGPFFTELFACPWHSSWGYRRWWDLRRELCQQLIFIDWAIAHPISPQIYSTQRLRSHNCGRASHKRGKHTRWQRLLQLLDLLRILQDECVQVSWAADLELGLGSLLVALYACSCISISLHQWNSSNLQSLPRAISPKSPCPFEEFSELVKTYRKHPCVCKSQWTILLLACPLWSSRCERVIADSRSWCLKFLEAFWRYCRFRLWRTQKCRNC